MNGNRDVPDLSRFRPELEHDEIIVADNWFSAVDAGYFDIHIVCSIPTFFELVRSVAFGVVTHNSALGTERHVDLGASEGTLCAAISFGSEGRIETFAVEPLPEMIERITRQTEPVSVIPNALATEIGFVSLDDEDAPVPVYNFKMESNYYTEIMTFQFLGPEREYYVDKVSKDLQPGGLFITCEKFSNSSREDFLRLEAIKDSYKSNFFDPETLARKIEEVLNAPDGGMNEGMLTPEEYELILLSHFSKVARFWDSGNFKGYVASNDEDSIELFLALLPPLNSKYSTVETPFYIER